MQRQLDYTIAEDAKQVGIMLAEDKANRESPGWSERALELMKEFLTTIPYQSFMCEQFRDYAESHGLPAPPHNRAYGGIMVTAKRQNLIKYMRTAQVSNPLAHHANAGVWTKA